MDPAHPEHRPPRTPLVPPGGVDLHERDMTATFSADVTLAAAQEQLARLGQWLPVDGDLAATLGRLIDTNSTGPLRLGYGAWRDLLLGVQFTNGRGELITAGGRTVKNVAGYDLTKFLVGQHGVFGRLVTLTTRTYRRPAGAIVAELEPTPEKAAELLPSPLRPQWMVLTADALLCGYLGDEPTLAFYRDRLPTIGPRRVEERSVDADVEHRRSLWCFAGPRTFRASVPPSKAIEFARQAKLDRWSADATFGVVVGDAPADGPTGLVAAAGALGGTATVLDHDADAAARATSSRMTPQERELLTRIKRAFDPENVLAPLPSVRTGT